MAMGAAASIELLHNAQLIHDDIEDESDRRRGKPTLHRMYGVPLALNAGDALGLLSLQPLKDNLRQLGLPLTLRIFRETERVAWESAEGQALELGWRYENQTDLRDEDYLGMVLQKTCWLAVIHPLRVGCLIGARGRLPLDPLIRLGFFCGSAFQIRDDILNVLAESDYGKDPNGDLVEGKRSLLLIHALRHADSADRAKLVRFLDEPASRRSRAALTWIRGLIDKLGSITYATAVASSLGGAALFEFDKYSEYLPESRDLSFIRSTMTWSVQRQQ